MKKPLLLLCLGICAVSAYADAVYRNGPGQGHASSLVLFGAAEYGDEITLAGTARNITEMSLYFISDVTTPQADERIRVKFYNLDGPVVNGKTSPGTVLWDSGQIPCMYYWRCKRITVPNITVPDTFAWSFQTSGTTQVSEDEIGPDQFGPPELGSSGNHLWTRSGGAWTWFAPANPWEGSLACTLWANGGPATPYDNISSYLNAVNYSSMEYGDDVCFEGTARVINSVQLRVNADLNTVQGDETLVLRLYAQTGADPYGSPEAAPIWTSGSIAVTPGANTVTVPVPAITVPDNIVYTVQFQGMAMNVGDRAGLMMYSPPITGTSHLLYWVHDGTTSPNGFYSTWFGDPTPSSVLPVANFGARFNSSGSSPTNIDPTSATVSPGSTIAGTWANILASDDVRWELRPGAILVATADPIVVIINGTAPGNTPNNLSVTVESSATAGGIRQIVEARKFADSTWTVLETFIGLPIGANPDRSVSLTIPSPSLHIGASNALQIRLRYKNSTAVLVYPWRARIDRVYWTYTP